MLYIDTDNALGSWSGDIDDGFALGYLLSNHLAIAGIGTVFGNTSEVNARRNVRRLIQITETSVSIYSGANHPGKIDSQASSFLVNHPSPLRVLALGPLTNLVRVIKERPSQIREIIIVGSRLTSKGKWPPYFPHEFNLTKDVDATNTVLNSGVPITFLPLDIAKKLRANSAWLQHLTGALAGHLRRHSKRWLIRNLLLKGRPSFPIWDLTAAVYSNKPELFKTETRTATVYPNGWLDWRGGAHPFRVITHFNPHDILMATENALSSL